MNGPRRFSNPIVALVAAWMLVVQSIVGAMAQGTGPVPLDVFGNALCITSTHASPGQGGLPRHDLIPDCCQAGCIFAAGAHAVPTVAIGIPAGHASAGTDTPRLAAFSLTTRPDPSPGAPRAPPLI
ncbi:MAG: hypothetical protein K5872_16845 [Rhizobiaceae bacterium]|nr:hypothetical protein [Rhizobiaceae bacterium]MCV0407892.1 hypothetical protein [Rhizobiaceae bacterium]